MSTGSLYTGMNTSTATGTVGARFSRTYSWKIVHQKPNACIALNSSAAIRIPYRTGVPWRAGTLSSQPKYQMAAGTPRSISRRQRRRTLHPWGRAPT